MVDKSRDCTHLITRMECAIRDADNLFADQDREISKDMVVAWKELYGSLVNQTSEPTIRKLWPAKRYQQLRQIIPGYLNLAQSLDQRVQEHNLQYEVRLKLKMILSATRDAARLLEVRSEFVEPDQYSYWRYTHREAIGIDWAAIYPLSKALDYMQLELQWYKLQETIESLPVDIQRHNEKVAADMVNYVYGKTGNVEGRRMDDQQLRCVSMNVRNHLVIAGAGTGKTTTIIARIKYLLATRQCMPKDILVLSFTKASAKEMAERIQKETNGRKIKVCTFHHLGLEIIKNCEKRKPALYVQSMDDFVKEHIDAEELAYYQGVTGQDKSTVIRLISTLITQMKSKGCSLEFLMERIQNSGADRNYNMCIFKLLAPVFKAYQSFLEDTEQMDFNDMLWKAIRLIREGQYQNQYKYVIVDEYQDISHAPDVLLHEMRKTSDFKLLCVGDDWQSIYRFNGSDIDYILHFEKYWGPAQISKIETTYRFSQQLVDISGKFVMKNPYQYKKEMVGKGSICEGFPLGIIRDHLLRDAGETMIRRFDHLPIGSTVFVLGRYKGDKNILKHLVDLQMSDGSEGDVSIKYMKRPDLQIRFLTIHKSKGLQADFVVIINNRNGKMGFPSRCQDPPILKLIMNNQETYPFDEERRLFYVAMTRARKKVYLLIQNDNVSDFVNELLRDYGKEIEMLGTCNKT